MPLSQSQSGKAFEYAIAMNFAELSGKSIINNAAKDNALASYKAHNLEQQKKFNSAGKKAAIFLQAKDVRLQKIRSIAIAGDSAGQKGDVRDIVITTDDGEVGVSAKNKNDAVKHSRLSSKIDFGKKWMDYPCRDVYFERVRPVFDLLTDYKKKKMLFNEVENKQQVIYKPILDAFEDEINFIWENFDSAAYNLLQYLIGIEDFYWVIKENGHVSLLSCNIRGNLKWGKKWKMPTSIESTKRENENKFIITFNNGWQISFRIHNASSRCEPSLKFDVRILGWPRSVTQETINIFE